MTRIISWYFPDLSLFLDCNMSLLYDKSIALGKVHFFFKLSSSVSFSFKLKLRDIFCLHYNAHGVSLGELFILCQDNQI